MPSVPQVVSGIFPYTDRFDEKEMSEQLKHIKGEALTIRAMAHFDLVKVYGMPYTKDNGTSLGVPVVTTRLETDAKPARNTVAEVYAQIIRDLEAASPLMHTRKEDARINWYGNRLLLARAYLYMGNNGKAYEVAADLISKAEADKNYGLVPAERYQAMWESDVCPEFLFVLINNADEVSNSKEFIGYLTHRSGYDDLALSSDYINLLDEDPKDERHKIIDKYKPKSYRWYLKKYNYPTYKYANIPVLRLAEAYLIAAEAAVKLDDKINATLYLNRIVQRANPKKEVTAEEISLERVLKERRKELVGEGHRLFDAMRNNQTIERKGTSHNSDLLLPETRKYDWNYYKIVLPIPQSEINVNPNMVQNEGYGK